MPFTGYPQDFSLAHFQEYPLLVNPAYTGFFMGDLRAGVVYKNRWKSVNAPFNSYVAFADGTLNKKMLGDGDFVTGGLHLIGHTAGDAGFGYVGAMLSSAYYKALSPGENHYLVLGASFGVGNRRLNEELLTFGNQFNGVRYDASIPHNEVVIRNNSNYADMGTGLLWFFSPSEDFRIHTGASYLHFNRTNLTYLGGSDQLDPKFTLIGEIRMQFTDLIRLVPSMLYISQGEFTETIIGAGLRHEFPQIVRVHPIVRPDNPETALTFGSWYRLDDAIILGLKVEYSYAIFSFSYDINISSLNEASHLKEGFEISAAYLFGNMWGDLKITERKAFK